MQQTGNGEEADAKHKTMVSFVELIGLSYFLCLHVIMEEKVMQVGNRICQYYPSPKCQ